jgi:hypothetical protein
VETLLTQTSPTPCLFHPVTAAPLQSHVAKRGSVSVLNSSVTKLFFHYVEINIFKMKKMKKKLIKNCIWSVAIYGPETWRKGRKYI